MFRGIKMNRSVREVGLILQDVTESYLDLKRSGADIDFNFFGVTSLMYLFLQTDEKILKEKKVVFNLFDFLSVFLNSYYESKKLSSRIIVEALFFFIERNVKLGLTDEKISDVGLMTDGFNIISFLLDLKNKKYEGNSFLDRYVNLNEQVISDLEAREDKVYFLTSIGKPFDLEEQRTVLANLKMQHSIIKMFYLDKKDSYTREEIEFVVRALDRLGCSHVTGCVREYLINKLEKRTKKEEINVSSMSSVFSTEIKSKPMISKKEHYELSGILSGYMDMELIRPLRALSKNEIAYVVDILVRLSYPTTQIEEFIRLCYKELRNSDEYFDVICDDIVSKVSFYDIDSPLVADILNNIKCYLDEYIQVKENNSEDALEWKSLIEEEIYKIEEFIPKDSEFEKEEIFKLVKEKEEN